MLPYLREEYGNPSSDYPLGHRAHQAIHESRELIASVIGAHPSEVVFTSGGTESNNLAIRGTAASASEERRRIVTSQVEHPATQAPCDLLERLGWTITRLPVTDAGSLDVESAIDALGEDVALLTVMLAQNETGAVMPIAEVALAARQSGIVVHTDAAQALGKIAVSVETLGVDLLSITGHKLYGPKGVGALYVRSGTPLHPLVIGGSQERGLRPGTENVAGIVGLAHACQLANSRLGTEQVRWRELREQLWRALSEKVVGMTRHTPTENSLANTLYVSFPNVLGRDILSLSPGLAASTGSACHAGDENPSAALSAMGVSHDVAMGAVRLSLGHGNTEVDVTAAAAILVSAHRVTLGQ